MPTWPKKETEEWTPETKPLKKRKIKRDKWREFKKVTIHSRKVGRKRVMSDRTQARA